MLSADKTVLLNALQKMCPKGKNLESFATHMETYFKKYEITSHKRIAMFLAQTMHECAMYTVFEENLNYDAAGLTRIWSKRFPPDVAAQYAKQKIKIANRAYGGINGNRDEASGDGWKYRGRGIIQITFHDNYAAFHKVFPESNCIAEPDQLALPQWSVASACHYWNSRKINDDADKADVKGATKKINGGDNGLNERTNLYIKLIAM